MPVPTLLRRAGMACSQGRSTMRPTRFDVKPIATTGPLRVAEPSGGWLESNWARPGARKWAGRTRPPNLRRRLLLNSLLAPTLSTYAASCRLRQHRPAISTSA